MIYWLPALLLLTGCPVVLPAAPDVVDPAALFERARTEPSPPSSYATFSTVITVGAQRLTANGTLVVSPPDRFRVELRGPIGPAQLVVTCNGHDVRAYVASENTYYIAVDADGALGRVLGAGEAVRGAAAATSLLMGRLPALDTVPALSASGSVATATWTRADGARLALGVDSRTAHLTDATATDASGVLLFSGKWAPDAWPTALGVRLPSLGVAADLRFNEWKGASPTDAAFLLVPPQGSTVRDLTLSPPP